MTAFVRPLSGCRVGLSISESEEASTLGFPTWQVNRATVRVVAALFGQGVGVVFGHDWREDGVMEAVHGFAQQMQPPTGGPQEPGKPLLHNLVPWPDKPRLSRDDRERLATTLSVREVGLPEDMTQFAGQALAERAGNPLHAYLRARGLTSLRRQLDNMSHARLCLGGRISGFGGRYPGIIEEALIALENGKPLYLAGLFGGASRQIIDAIEGKAMPESFGDPSRVAALYRQPPVSEDSENKDARIEERGWLWERFGSTGGEIAEAGRLTLDEWRELFHTTALDRVIQLVLTGLSRLRRPETQR